MKIALIYDAVYPWMKGGGEKTLWDIAVGLGRRGHVVHLYGCHFWEGPQTLLKEGVTLHGVCPAGDFYQADGRRGLLQPLRFAAGLFFALCRDRRMAFDVIYCTVFPFFSVFSVWLYRLLTGNRVPWALGWLEIWGSDYWKKYLASSWKGNIGACIEKLCVFCCPNHVVISELQKKRLIELLGVAEAQIEVIPRGLDLSGTPANPEKVADCVIYVGRLIDYKNVASVVKAWPLVLERRPQATLRIIGSGPAETVWRELVVQLKLSDHVEFLPPLANAADIQAEIAAASILVQPSIREGQSLVVLESMAAGTLVIASRHAESAVSDFIVSGENGWLIESPHDPTEWAEKISSQLSDLENRARLIAAGKTVAARFDLQTAVIPRLENYFSTIITSS